MRLPQASRTVRHLQPEALCAATALMVHGQLADSSQSSLSEGLLLRSASPRQIVTAAPMWVLRPMSDLDLAFYLIVSSFSLRRPASPRACVALGRSRSPAPSA